MPEGVEVRKYGDILRANILNKTITKINILHGRYTKKPFEGYNDLVKNLPLNVESVDNKGKFTYITLKTIDKTVDKTTDKTTTFYLLNTLGMSGGWTILNKTKAQCKNKVPFDGSQHTIELFYMQNNIDDTSHTNHTDITHGYYCYPRVLEYISNNNMTSWFQHALNHLNIEFELNDGSKFYYYDQRNFGTLKVITTLELLHKKLNSIGNDMMYINLDDFKKSLKQQKNSEKPIGNVLVNQKIISGIGNYLRADILWMAQISPFRKVSELNDTKIELIYNCARALMWGDYNIDYAREKHIVSNKFKIPTDYKRDFFVYKQETDIDGKKVRKDELFEGSQKRFIYWIDSVQK